MLAVFPDTFDDAAAAAVWEMEHDPAQDTLGRLLQYSMLEWNDATKRYRLHDLTRDFAKQRLMPAECGATAFLHAKHYLEVIRKADDLYKKGGESLMRGLALFDLERGNIQAGQAWAADHAAEDKDMTELCSGYPDRGAYILDLRQHPVEQIRWRESALAAARRMKDRAAEGRHLGNLGNPYVSLGETRRAIEYYENSLAIARELGNRQCEGEALGSLGGAYYSSGDYRRAIEYHEQRLIIAQEIGHRRGEGNALGNLGGAYYSSGDYRRAIEYYEQSLAVKRSIGDRRGEGNSLFNTSLALDGLGDRKKAIEHAEAALKIYEQIEDPNAAKVRKKLEIWRNG